MSDESYNATKKDFIMALRIIYREGLSDAFAHLSVRSSEGNEMMFMPTQERRWASLLNLIFPKNQKERFEPASKDSSLTAILPRTEIE
jgi:hypothetical protein